MEISPPSNEVAGIKEYKSANSCSICSKEAKSRCQKCLSIVYCSKSCQKNGWSKHKDICNKIEKTKMIFQEEASKIKAANYFERFEGDFYSVEVRLGLRTKCISISCQV